ncbi:MAG: cytochrome c biogenesis protein CcsA [Anaerohalosphaera sp.]|nr:cytochrome c biogenesis protein CcsA [Anaerohalosphaera sp.]
MLELPLAEKLVYVAVLFCYGVATLECIFDISKGRNESRVSLLAVVALAVSLESVLLIFRAVAIKAIPLTGLFESMILLTLVFGLTFLFLSTMVRKVWFASIMIWIIFGVALLGAKVAEPASEPHPIAQKPWIILHGFSMVMSAASLGLSAATAGMFLVFRRRLKNKQISKIIGKMPNIEKLERINLITLKACFIFMTFGLVSGAGYAVMKSASLRMAADQWLLDSKILMVLFSWVLVAFILGLRHIIVMKSRLIAQLTITAFVMILFAVAGSTIFCSTTHDFSGEPGNTSSQLESEE